jgi:Planctomycete cytochrome C
MIVAVALGAVIASGCDYGLAPTTATTPTPTTGGSGGSTTGLTFDADVAPILNADCIQCHGGARRDGGVDLSFYSTVLKVLTPGNANSKLIIVTQSGGLMFSQLTGNRNAKAAIIKDWIVTYSAVQR